MPKKLGVSWCCGNYCLLAFCGVGIVQCLFNLLYYVIGVRNTKKPPRNWTVCTIAHAHLNGFFSQHVRELIEFLVFLFSRGLKHHKFCYSYD